HLVYVNYFIREHFSPLTTMSEETIVKKFRLPREQILQLLHLVGPDFPEIQLLAALRFYAVGSFLEVVGDGYGLSKTSVKLGDLFLRTFFPDIVNVGMSL
ncbi:hypothetical protein M9458_055809, partial [Cirrhinus mrigala]